MKIAIAATGKDLAAPFAPNFGRATNFIIFDTQTRKPTSYLNPAIASAHNKGLLAAQFIVERGVNAVISNYFGPHAAKILAAANIQMLLAPTTGDELLACFEAGQLRQFVFEARERQGKEKPIRVEQR